VCRHVKYVGRLEDGEEGEVGWGRGDTVSYGWLSWLLFLEDGDDRRWRRRFPCLGVVGGWWL